MPNLVQLPPLVRTVIYYLLGVLNAANVAAFLVLGSDNKWLLAAQVFLGAVSGLFFGVAASNVRATPDPLPTSVNAIYGRGVAPGGKWAGWVYPNLDDEDPDAPAKV